MKLWIALATLFVFAAGFALGGATFRVSSSRPAPAPAGVPFWDGDPFYRIFSSEDCSRELELSEDQQQQFKAVLRSHESGVQELDRSRRALREKLRQDIGALLTAEQNDKLAEFQRSKARRQLQIRVESELADLTEKLALTDSEGASVKSILSAYVEDREKLVEPSRQQIEALREGRNAKLRGVLSADKYAKYIAYKESQWDMRKRSGGKSEKKGPAP